MELNCTKNALVEGIQIVQNAVTQKSSLPILSNVLLEAENNTLKLTATDLDIGICATLPVSIIQQGSITVPAKKFFDIVRALPENSEISLSIKKNNFVTVKCGKAQFKIIGLPKEEFPQLPIFKDREAITIEQSKLKEMLALTDFAISKDDTRFVLNGIFFIINADKVSMVATDGRRLAFVSQKLSQKSMVDRTGIVPTKTVQEVKRMLDDEGEVVVKFNDTQILFSFKNSFILSRLIEGDYPNYKNVIPAKTSKNVIIGREEFLAATRRASIFTDQDSMAIKLSIKGKKLIISKNTPYLGEAKEEIGIDYTGNEDFEVGFNPAYLIDVLKNMTEEKVVFEVSDATKPGVIRRGEEYTYVVLPMQLTM